jgi:Helix-turn-helix domain
MNGNPAYLASLRILRTGLAVSNPMSNSQKCKTKPKKPDDAASQRERLLALLRVQPLDTIQIRDRLGILSPASRIYELRKMGYNILTSWKWQWDEVGRPHKIASYFLRVGLPGGLYRD